MNLTPMKANMTEIEIDGKRVLFSYKTPVVIVDENGEVFVTGKFWSKTTTRHINQYLNGIAAGSKTRPQEFFDEYLNKVK